MTKATETLFAYGTLLEIPVQLAVFGRVIQSVPDRLAGYTKIENAVAGRYPALNRCQTLNCGVLGARLALNSTEWALADAYETESYYRKLFTLDSGVRAWVYLASAANQTKA
ncbi:MAG: hypothetical protein RLZZ241_875 [Bacteroidota bacterium]|jgi:hypothetical protein